MTSIQIIIHKKLNAIQCFCGFVSVNHKCKEKIQGKIIFRECNVNDCTKFCDQIRRDEYNEERWATDRDGYLVCGICYEKLSSEICTDCFCKVCYISVDEYCDCSPYE